MFDTLRNVIKYTNTGKIVCIMQTNMLPQSSSTELYIEGVANPSTSYVDVETQQILPLKSMQLILNKDELIADGSDAVVISGIPENTMAIIKGSVIKIDDGTFELTATEDGYHSIVFICDTYQTKEVKIRAI